MYCSRCKQDDLTADDFYLHCETGKPMCYCKECLKEYNKENMDLDKVKEYRRNYYLNHIKPLKTDRSKSAIAYREHTREYQRQYRLKRKNEKRNLDEAADKKVASQMSTSL